MRQGNVSSSIGRAAVLIFDFIQPSKSKPGPHRRFSLTGILGNQNRLQVLIFDFIQRSKSKRPGKHRFFSSLNRLIKISPAKALQQHFFQP